MLIEKQRISGSQLRWLAVSFIVGGPLIIDPASYAKHLSWLVVLIALTLSLFFVWIFTSLAKKFPNETPITYNNKLFGPFLGTIFSIGIIIVAFVAGTLLIKDYLIFGNVSLPETPDLAFIPFMILIASYALFLGVEVMGRSATLFTPLSIIMILFITALSIQYFDLYQVLPVWFIDSTEAIQFVNTLIFVMSFPFLELVIFLMFFPLVKDPKKATKGLFEGLIIGGLIILITSFRNVAVFGDGVANELFPAISVARNIHIGTILTRFEIFVTMTLNLNGFIGSIVTYYAAILGIAQLLKLKTYKVVILPFALVAIITVSLIPSNISYIAYFDQNIWPYFAFTFGLVFPVAGLIRAHFLKPKSSPNSLE